MLTSLSLLTFPLGTGWNWAKKNVLDKYVQMYPFVWTVYSYRLLSNSVP